MAERRKKRRYFIEERREAYLENLRRTANHAAAARAAGITDGGARRFRRREPGFEALCVEAEAEAQRRLAGAESPYDGTREGAFESIRRGADGKLKIQAQGRRRWSTKAEDIFFDALRECGNISASARAAGVSREAVWKRRREWPAFARRFEETMEEAEIVLEYRVACLGTNWSVEAQPREAANDNEAEAPPSQASAEPSTAFDPELAIRFLKWRAERKRGQTGAMAALPPAEEVRERIVRKVAAIKRHKALMARRAGEDENDSSSARFRGEGDQP